MVLPETDLAVRKDSRLRPDLGFFSAETWHSIDRKRVPVVEPPAIAVEIISPSETATTIDRKVEAYLKWGGSQCLSEGAFLTSVLIPGFRVRIADLFEDL